MNATEAFTTTSKPYLQPLSTSNTSIRALITTNDTLSDGYTFQKTADGMGAFVTNNETIDVFVNHELDNSEDGEYAKVSKLTLDRNGSILSGKLIEKETGFTPSFEDEELKNTLKLFLPKLIELKNKGIALWNKLFI